MQQLADGVVAVRNSSQRGVSVDLVVITPPDSALAQVATLDQIADNAVSGPLGHPHGVG